MPFSTSDPIVAASRGSIDAAARYTLTTGAHRAFAMEYIQELWRLCQTYKMDFAILFAQFCDETARGTSPIWYADGNPAGIGITDGGRVDIPYATGSDAARAHVVHMHAYVYGPIPTNSPLREYIKLDPRYQAALNAYGGVAKKIADLAGRWATNKNYANQIVGHANAAFPNVGAPQPAPTQPSTGGSMPTPKIIDKWLHVAQDGYPAVNRRYAGANGQDIIVIHIQEGTNWGSWQHFHSVSASSTVFVGRNGDIWRLVPESDGPWTNGDVCSPTQKGRDIINRYGGDPNYYSLTIETEGFASSNNALGWLAWPKPQAQLDSVVWQVRQWMDKYNIPIERVVRHADINQCSRPGCPGDTFYNYVIAALKSGGGSTVEEPEVIYADRSPVKDADGNLWTGEEDLKINGATFHAEKRTVKAVAGVTFRTHASRKAGLTRPTLEAGKGFSVLGWVNGEEVNGERRWWITESYSRVHVSGTVEKPTPEPLPLPDEDTDPQQPDEQPEIIEYGPEIVNGRAYYPLSLFLSEPAEPVSEETPVGVENDIKLVPVHEMTVIVTEDEADARRSVSLKAPVRHTFKKGDEIVVTHFVVGDEVDGEELWWVIKPSDSAKNPLRHGLRIPCAFTNVRPS